MLQLNRFDYETIRNEGQIRFDRGSGLWHKKEVIKLSLGCLNKDEKFLTRARLRWSKDGRELPAAEQLVADHYNIPWNTITEVRDHEPVESIARKRLIWEKHGFHFEVIEKGRNGGK